MKRFSIMNCPARAGRLGALLLVLPFLLSSCVSYDSWNRTTTGMGFFHRCFEHKGMKVAFNFNYRQVIHFSG